MKRVEIYEVAFKKHYDRVPLNISVDDIPAEFLVHGQGFELRILEDEGFFSENNSWDPFTEVIIYRKRMENDEEYNKRITQFDEENKRRYERRYKQYLELKAEFENEGETAEEAA